MLSRGDILISFNFCYNFSAEDYTYSRRRELDIFFIIGLAHCVRWPRAHNVGHAGEAADT